MSPHRRPGWEAPGGHIVRSNMEAALCARLTGANIEHTHWSLDFDVPLGTDQLRLFSPSIALTELKKDGCTILIEPIDSIQPGSGLRRIQSFRTQHRHDYFVILVARRALHHRVPEEVYDALFPLEDLKPLVEFLRRLR